MNFKPFYVKTEGVSEKQAQELLNLAVKNGSEGEDSFLEAYAEYEGIEYDIGVKYFGVGQRNYTKIENGVYWFGEEAVELTYEQALLHVKGEVETKQEEEMTMNFKPFYVLTKDLTKGMVADLWHVAAEAGAEPYFEDVSEAIDSTCIGVDYEYDLVCSHYPSEETFGTGAVELTYEQAILHMRGELESCIPPPTVLEEPTSDGVDLIRTFIYIRDSEHSEAVQEYLFSRGCKWWYGGFTHVEGRSGKFIGVNGSREIITIASNSPFLKEYDEVFIDYEKKYTYTVTSTKDTKVKKLQKELEEAKELVDKLQQEIDALLS